MTEGGGGGVILGQNCVTSFMNAPKEHQRILTIIKKVLEHVVRLLLEQSMADAGHTAFCLQGLSFAA